MKTPTTEYSINVESNRQITDAFLKGLGMALEEEKPLFNTYKKGDTHVTIGLYGELTIARKHWLNDEFDRIYSGINPDITINDFFKIVELLKIENLSVGGN